MVRQTSLLRLLEAERQDEGRLKRLLERLLGQEEVKVEVKVEVKAKVEGEVEVEIEVRTHVPTSVATQVKIRPDQQRVLLREIQRPLGAGNHKHEIPKPTGRSCELRVASYEERMKAEG